MDNEVVKKIVESVAREMAQFNFSERHNDIASSIAGVVKKSWNPLRRIFGGHGIAAVVVVPESVTDRVGLKVFFQGVRKEINSRFVGVAAYKSSYSFIVLLCPHNLFAACPEVASELKDRTGLHMNIIQGVILVNSDTREVTGDYTRPSLHKREYEAVLAATSRAVK